MSSKCYCGPFLFGFAVKPASISDVLLNRAGYAREHVVCIRSNQSDRAHCEHQNNSQHYGIFRYVLAFILSP